MESSAGRLFGSCISGLDVFLLFLAQQFLIPATQGKGRSQGWLSAHH